MRVELRVKKLEQLKKAPLIDILRDHGVNLFAAKGAIGKLLYSCEPGSQVIVDLDDETVLDAMDELSDAGVDAVLLGDDPEPPWNALP